MASPGFGIGIIMDIIKSPFGQLVMTILGGGELERKQNEFNAESEKTLQEIIAGSKELESVLTQKTNKSNAQIQELIENLANKTQKKLGAKNAELQQFLTQLGERLDTGFESRNARVEELLEGTNEQTIKDINRSFDTRQDALSQNLINVGLSGGTTGIEPAGLLERDRGDTIASARQGHAFNLANIIAGLETDRIGTQRDIGFAQADFDRAFTGQQIDSDILLRGGGIDAQNQANQNMINIARDMGMFRFNTQANVNRIPPQPSFLLQQAQQQGQNATGTPDTPSAFESAAPGLATAAIFALSDREAKHNISQIDVDEILQKVDDLPVDAWTYKDDVQNALHVGPMAQDFFEQFGLGQSDKVINAVDGIGVALAAIKGLKKEIARRDDRLLMLENRIAAMEGVA